MSLRDQSIKQVQQREKIMVESPSDRVSEYYASNVFTEDTMEKYVSKGAFEAWKNCIKTGAKIDRETAEHIAAGMKTWAISKGVKSYTHWFQPLTGSTAEKHDSFFTPNSEGKAMETFGSSSLVQQEPDASSFPNGGIRQTFEARGYTAWDPSSPAFIMENNNGKTLCIPTIFISYTGETLDYKAPLLKSLQYLESAVLPVVQWFDKNTTKITSTLGWEQEYFLVDEALYQARPDLQFTGRTLIGATSAKGQQLEDHYFGAIPDRVLDYMVELELECHKLGIPIRTRHNEVAPNQFECAPMFEEANVAVDHNQLLMDIMDRIAKRHKLRVLLHEKPFKGVNGSGKHNNWSMSTDTGKNLLSPGKTPKNNLLFLTTFVNVIKAVNEHADLIRAAIASASNDHRLGANEAPPAIISVFIGSALTSVLDEIEKRVGDKKYDELYNSDLKLDIHNKIPDLMLDNTDRNRTSPFAFTGNKFEIRAVGSSANCAQTMIVMNTIVAQQFVKFKQEVEKLKETEGEKQEGAIMRVLKSYIKESRRILFEGDNYSEAWAKEAEKRGLSNVKTTPKALDFFITKKAKELFAETKVLSERELEARYEILCHNYTLKIQLEGRILGEMAINRVIPAAIQYQNQLIQNIKGLKDLGMKSGYEAQSALLADLSKHIQIVYSNTEQMIQERKKANTIADPAKQSKAYCDKVKPFFDIIRDSCDKIEMMVDDSIWSLPKYSELLFLK